MTFTYDGADLSKVIQDIYLENGKCVVTYLDGSTDEYYCEDNNEIERLKQLMITQALERQEKMDTDKLELIKHSCSLGKFFSILILLASAKGYIDESFINLSIALFAVSFGFSKNANPKLKELKKYKLFLELLSKYSINDISDCVKKTKGDDLYLPPLDINTLDNFSYGYVKSLHKSMINYWD